MAIFNLSFASKRAIIKVLRETLASDPLFQPDKTGPSRSSETLVYDEWGYQVRDFPVVVVQVPPGKFRRMGIGDTVRPFFGVPLVEEAGGTTTLRTFDVPLVIPPDFNVELRYNGDATGMNPQPPFQLPVKQKMVGPLTVNYVELTGANIGPASAFPLANFEASTQKVPTGQVFGGWWDGTATITGVARSTPARDMLGDRLAAILWLEKKRALRKLGVVVLDVQPGGISEQPYGADKIYYTKINVALATEFEAIAQFVETVQDVTVTAVAV